MLFAVAELLVNSFPGHTVVSITSMRVIVKSVLFIGQHLHTFMIHHNVRRSSLLNSHCCTLILLRLQMQRGNVFGRVCLYLSSCL